VLSYQKCRDAERHDAINHFPDYWVTGFEPLVRNTADVRIRRNRLLLRNKTLGAIRTE